MSRFGADLQKQKLGDGAAKEIFIEWGGGCRTANININVNGKDIFHDGNCDGHSRKFS